MNNPQFDIYYCLQRKRISAIVCLLNADTLMLYCQANYEKRLTRWLRWHYKMELISRVTYTAPVYELKFRFEWTPA